MRRCDGKNQCIDAYVKEIGEEKKETSSFPFSITFCSTNQKQVKLHGGSDDRK
jgi:hypothetical protein